MNGRDQQRWARMRDACCDVSAVDVDDHHAHVFETVQMLTLSAGGGPSEGPTGTRGVATGLGGVSRPSAEPIYGRSDR